MLDEKSQKFRLKNVDKTSNYLIEEIRWFYEHKTQKSVHSFKLN